jgi:DNA-binding NtrC family response regulator
MVTDRKAGRISMKILVVDDESIVLDSCKRVLEADGFDAYLVPSADKALEAIEYGDFALILIDVKMPGHDGIYLMREVKEKWPDIPIIVMSGYHTLETIEEAIETGADAFIPKPFTPDELLEALRQVIEKERRYEKEKGPGN